MATAREFLIIIRLKNEKESDVFPYLSRIEKSLKDQGFTTRRADNSDIKRLLGVYYEHNVTTEQYEDFDGERWVILSDEFTIEIQIADNSLQCNHNWKKLISMFAMVGLKFKIRCWNVEIDEIKTA